MDAMANTIIPALRFTEVKIFPAFILVGFWLMVKRTMCCFIVLFELKGAVFLNSIKITKSFLNYI